MTRLCTPWWPIVRYDCDGTMGDGECSHQHSNWSGSYQFYEFDKPWIMLKAHGWTHYTLDGWTHHRCGLCNNDLKLEEAKGPKESA